MFTVEELKVIAQALANAQVAVGQAKVAVELLDKVIGLIEGKDKK